MLFPCILTLSIATAGMAEGELDRTALIHLLDGAQVASCQDVSFDYEGKEVVPGIEREGLKLGPDGLHKVYTGTFRRRDDGATSVELFTFDKRLNKHKHGHIVILNEVTQSSAIQSDQRKARIKFKGENPLDFAGHGNYRTIWLTDWVRKLARSPYLYDYVGHQQVEGTECLVVRFRLVYDESQPKNTQVSYTFFMDMNRDGHVVRLEHRWGNDLVGLTTVRLDKFTTNLGRAAWIPVSGREESRLALREGQTKFLDEPVYTISYDMIPVTLRFNQGLKDTDFTVQAKPGDAVSDEVRKAKFEYGQYMVRPKAETRLPSDAEVKANLEQMLKDKAVMANELRASSPLRDAPGVLTSWPWALAGLAASGAGLYYRRGRNS